MSAASYVGRVGGLAIALGIGTAIITGQGVAYADGTEASISPPSQSQSESPRGDSVTPDKRPFGKRRSAERTTLSDTVKGIADRVVLTGSRTVVFA